LNDCAGIRSRGRHFGVLAFSGLYIITEATYTPDTDKRARVIAQSDLFVGGSVRFPRRATWLEECTAELLAFPGRHDDQVDALTQGLAWGRQRRGEVSVRFVPGLY
jgi:predicted phage terminase large subunit-like protein